MITQEILQARIDSANETLNEAIETYKIDALWALFSGGHDSLVATHVTSKHPKFAGVIHIDTGTGLPQTRQFVKETCKAHKWDLIIKSPATTYEMLIVRYGFPGAPQHQHMYRYLKERPLMQAKIEARKRSESDVIALVGGMRAQESARRMGHIQKIHKDSKGIWVSAIHDWSALECSAYIAAYNLKRSIVKDTIHLSGECFCGSYARPSEKRELKTWYPEHAAKIEAWQTLVKTAVDLGLSSIPFNHQQWGHEHGISDSQMELPMCWNCRGDDD